MTGRDSEAVVAVEAAKIQIPPIWYMRDEAVVVGAPQTPFLQLFRLSTEFVLPTQLCVMASSWWRLLPRASLLQEEQEGPSLPAASSLVISARSRLEVAEAASASGDDQQAAAAAAAASAISGASASSTAAAASATAGPTAQDAVSQVILRMARIDWCDTRVTAYAWYPENVRTRAWVRCWMSGVIIITILLLLQAWNLRRGHPCGSPRIQLLCCVFSCSSTAVPLFAFSGRCLDPIPHLRCRSRQGRRGRRRGRHQDLLL